MAPDTKRSPGTFMVWRRNPNGIGKLTSHGHSPRFRHQTFEAAQTEAERLAALFPQSTFVIMQEAGRVKMKPVELAA